MGPSLLSTLHFLASTLRSLGVAIMIEKWKVIFLLWQWSTFLCFTFLSRSLVQWQGYCLGHIWPAPRALLCLASGLLFGRPPLLSFFPYSTWNSSVSNSLPLRQLSLLPLPLGTNRFHNVDWWDDCRVSQGKPSLEPEEWWNLMPIINSLKKQGLLISCSSPYNKILIKINFKTQVTK
jgi:hypothetical protein